MVSELLAGSGPVVAWSAQEASGDAAAAASAPAAAAKRDPAVTAASEARLQQHRGPLHDPVGVVQSECAAGDAIGPRQRG